MERTEIDVNGAVHRRVVWNGRSAGRTLRSRMLELAPRYDVGKRDAEPMTVQPQLW